MMGTGEAEGENRSMAATEPALNNPQLMNILYKVQKDYLLTLLVVAILNFLRLMLQLTKLEPR